MKSSQILKDSLRLTKLRQKNSFYLQRSFFYQDINTLDTTVLDVAAEDIIKAESLILKRYMKPFDSIQLAIALNIQSNELTFVSSDQKLCNIAKDEGLLILNP